MLAVIFEYLPLLRDGSSLRPPPPPRALRPLPCHRTLTNINLYGTHLPRYAPAVSPRIWLGTPLCCLI